MLIVVLPSAITARFPLAIDSNTVKYSAFSTLLSSFMATEKQRMVPAPSPDGNERVFEDMRGKSRLATRIVNQHRNLITLKGVVQKPCNFLLLIIKINMMLIGIEGAGIIVLLCIKEFGEGEM